MAGLPAGAACSWYEYDNMLVDLQNQASLAAASDATETITDDTAFRPDRFASATRSAGASR